MTNTSVSPGREATLNVLVKDGTVVTPSHAFQVDIRVRDGKIALVSSISDIDAEKTVNAERKLVFAGGIDTVLIAKDVGVRKQAWWVHKPLEWFRKYVKRTTGNPWNPYVTAG